MRCGRFLLSGAIGVMLVLIACRVIIDTVDEYVECQGYDFRVFAVKCLLLLPGTCPLRRAKQEHRSLC